MIYLFSYLQSSLAQWLGLLVLAPLSIEHGQVVECSSNLDDRNKHTQQGLDYLELSLTSNHFYIISIFPSMSSGDVSRP